MMAAIRYRFVSMLVLAMTLPLAMAMMAFAESGSHGDGHAEMHEHYNKWIDNRGFGCCDNRDCRPVHADATQRVGGCGLMANGSGCLRTLCCTFPRRMAAATSAWLQAPSSRAASYPANRGVEI